MQLTQAIFICSIHNEGVGVGNIKTGLNDGGGDQDIEFAFPEVDNDLLKLVLGELTVGNTQAQLATLGPKDILIQPDLGKEVTTASFEKAALACLACKLITPTFFPDLGFSTLELLDSIVLLYLNIFDVLAEG